MAEKDPPFGHGGNVQASPASPPWKDCLDGTPRQVFAHYKELEEVGLAAPQVTYLMHELKQKGLPVDVDATTMEEAKASILNVFGAK